MKMKYDHVQVSALKNIKGYLKIKVGLIVNIKVDFGTSSVPDVLSVCLMTIYMVGR